MKKAISTVIATVLIILITVAAITIVWAAIIPMIKKQMASGSVCLDAVAEVSLLTSGGFTCINNGTAPSLSIQVKYGPRDIGLTDIQALVTIDGQTSSKYLKKDLNFNMPKENEERVYIIQETDIADIARANKVEIAPVVGVGATEEPCDVSSSATLRLCK